jgi:hypothetical protein
MNIIESNWIEFIWIDLVMINNRYIIHYIIFCSVKVFVEKSRQPSKHHNWEKEWHQPCKLSLYMLTEFFCMHIHKARNDQECVLSTTNVAPNNNWDLFKEPCQNKTSLSRQILFKKVQSLLVITDSGVNT